MVNSTRTGRMIPLCVCFKLLTIVNIARARNSSATIAFAIPIISRDIIGTTIKNSAVQYARFSPNCHLNAKYIMAGTQARSIGKTAL